MKLFHITSRAAWMDAVGKGLYEAPSLASEGFIHCSTASQVVPVARQFYRGRIGLILLVIESTRLHAALRWEPAADSSPADGVRESDKFPHVYGPINLDAVLQVVDFEPEANGEFTLPASLTQRSPEDPT